MEAISFVKNFKNGHGWEQTAITEEEEKTLKEQIQIKNDLLMRRCFETAEKIIGKYTIPPPFQTVQLTRMAILRLIRDPNPSLYLPVA